MSPIDAVAARLGLRIDQEEREFVADEQLRMVWAHAAAGTIVATAFAVLMAINFRQAVGLFPVYVWIAVKIAIAAIRVTQAQLFRHEGSPGGVSWRRRTYAMLALDGLVFGAAGYALVGLDHSTAALAIASLCGIACVAAFGLQVDRIAAAAYIVPILGPAAAGCFLRGDAFGAYCGAGLALFMLQAHISASRAALRLAEVFLLRKHAARISAERAEALELVERQSAVKSQFLGTVSHELRTPIHGMLGVARLVHVESTDPLVKHRMELIESSGTHLLSLVTDLIDVSRIDSGQMRIHRVTFDLFSEVERVADIYAVRAAEKGLAFTLDSDLSGPTWVNGDPARTRQVLHNLLGNAIKFTNEGWIQLSVLLGERLGDVTFRIRDTGIGISEEDQKTVFDAFRQVSPKSDGRRQGTGLGLTIAHEIAQLLDGSIQLRSTPGFGSIFEFQVRLEPADPPVMSASAATVAEDDEGGFRILVVEDNDVNFLIASSMLANLGHQVERAMEGGDAVRRALREIDRPELILMDCMMPGMDGFEATRSIRVQESAMGLSRVPIIALSAIVDEDMGRKALAAGMDDALGKPFSNEDLRRAIRPWLALHDSERVGALKQEDGRTVLTNEGSGVLRTRRPS